MDSVVDRFAASLIDRFGTHARAVATGQVRLASQAGLESVAAAWTAVAQALPDPMSDRRSGSRQSTGYRSGPEGSDHCTPASDAGQGPLDD